MAMFYDIILIYIYIYILKYAHTWDLHFQRDEIYHYAACTKPD